MLSHPRHGRAARAARSFLILLLALSALAAAAAPHFRARQGDAARAAAQSPPAAREVRFTVTVTNEKGRHVVGLGAEHVEVFDGKSPRELASFGPAEDYASVGVLFDISGSMRNGSTNKVERMRHAFARFFRQASPRNEYFLWAFNKQEIMLTDWTSDARALGEGVNKIAPATMPTEGRSGTALRDACAAALDKLSGGSHPRRVLLVLTDGSGDNASSRARLKDLKRALRDSDALLYALVFIDRNDPGALDVAGQAELDELVSVSGGRVFFCESDGELSGAVDYVATELRSQYAVAFAPADAAKKGELNKVRIKIKKPPDLKGGLYVRAREGYLTPQ